MNKKHIVIYFCILFLLPCSIQAQGASGIPFIDSIYVDYTRKYLFDEQEYVPTEEDRELIQALYASNTRMDNPVNYARIQCMDALYHFYHIPQDYHKAIELADEALSVLNKEKYPEEYAPLLLLKSIAYLYTENSYVDAYHYMNELLQMPVVKKNPVLLASTYSHLGLLWRDLGEYSNALECCAQAERAYRDAGYKLSEYLMQANAATIYVRTGEHEKVIRMIQDVLPKLSEKDTLSMIYLTSVLGSNYVQMGDLDSAYLYLNKSQNLIDAYHLPIITRKSTVMFHLGKLYFLKQDYPQSMKYLERLLTECRQANLLRFESETYGMMSEMQEYYGNKDEALQYLKMSVQIKDSVAIEEQAHELQRLKSHAELVNYQQQLQIAEQTAKIKQARSFSAILILLLCLIIISFVLFYINRKKKLKEMENEQLAQQLKNEEINNRLEKLEYEQEMEKKKREVATTQMLVAEKSRVLEHLLTTFRPFYEDKKISTDVWKEMQNLVVTNLRKDSEWEKSKVHFEQVHPDFFKKLKELAPELGESELRVAAYIRIGMRTKQIAEMLSIDDRSVIISRYRIKKKLNLEKEISLDDYIRNV